MNTQSWGFGKQEETGGGGEVGHREQASVKLIKEK